MTTATKDRGKAARAAQRAEIRKRLACPFVLEGDAGAYLFLEASTLATYRVKGGGPRYRKHLGRVAYHLDDLDEWSEQQARFTTSDKKE